MAKARDALYFQQVERSEINAEIVAIDRVKLPEAKKMIRDFRHKFCRKLGEDEVRDGLYCIAIQFFELTERG